MAWWKSGVNSWRKFQKLSGCERSLLLQALLLLPLTAYLLRLFGFRRLYAAMAQWLPPKRNLIGTPRTAPKAIARLVQLASWHGFYAPNCLQRSLVLWGLLRRQGIESDLRIGVRKQTGQFEAHAWVEYEGCVLNDSQEVHQQFAPFAEAIRPVGVKAA